MCVCVCVVLHSVTINEHILRKVFLRDMLSNWVCILKGSFTAIEQTYNGPVKQVCQEHFINVSLMYHIDPCAFIK